LSNSPKTLEFRSIYQPHGKVVELYVPVYRIMDELHEHHVVNGEENLIILTPKRLSAGRGLPTLLPMEGAPLGLLP